MYIIGWYIRILLKFIPPILPIIGWYILIQYTPFTPLYAVAYFNGQETCFAIFVQDGKHVYTWRLLCNGLLLPFQTNWSDLFDGLKRLKTPHQHSFPFHRSSWDTLSQWSADGALYEMKSIKNIEIGRAKQFSPRRRDLSRRQCFKTFDLTAAQIRQEMASTIHQSRLLMF